MQEIPFIKMHGLGNDFVIIDQRKQATAQEDDPDARVTPVPRSQTRTRMRFGSNILAN